MRSIRRKLAVNFIIVILFTVILLEILIINIVRQNYYKNLEDSLFSQIKVSTDLYSRYFSDSSLYDNVLNNVDTFWKQTTAQVQIIDTSGKVLMDSIGIIPGKDFKADDIKEAMKGQKGKWIGKVDYDNEKVMAVSYPLKSHNKIVGALRFVTSLRAVNNDVRSVSNIFILVGAMVVLISVFISLLLANSIVNPLREVTKAAEKMAAGNFKVQSIKKNDDEIGQLSDTLNYMAEEILKKDQLKNEFIGSVSHELRTPLTSIKGWAVTLREGNLEDREMLRDGLDIIEKESDRLTAMVEELLDFSKFVSGKVTINKENVNVAELMQHIGKQMEPRAEIENIGFEIAFEQALPTLEADENRLKQVFINILDNSFNFTPAGGKVTFTASQEDNRLVFHISDTGCGIPPDELPKVKEKFYKGRNSKSKNGIGLSICDEIIRLMDGTFEIKSEINKGTDTFITLPLPER